MFRWSPERQVAVNHREKREHDRLPIYKRAQQTRGDPYCPTVWLGQRIQMGKMEEELGLGLAKLSRVTECGLTESNE